PACSNPAPDGHCPSSGETTISLGGGGAPLDASGSGSSGVKLDGGRVVLDASGLAASLPPIIWVANTGEGTISKIDTRTLKELARYRTGPTTTPGTPDPSRTTVGMAGDVVVATRAASR